MEKMPELKQEHNFEIDKEGYVYFGDVAIEVLNQQSQYASRYVDNWAGHDNEYPKLGDGLRIKGNSADYHFMKIHKDDIDEFVKRYKEYREING